MRIQVGDIVDKNLSVKLIDKDSGAEIKMCIWADDKTGEFEVFKMDGDKILMNDNKTEFLTEKKIGNIEFLIEEYD